MSSGAASLRRLRTAASSLILEEQARVLLLLDDLRQARLAHVFQRLESQLVGLDLLKRLVALGRVHLRELGVLERALLHELDLFGGEVAQVARRHARPELARRHLLAVRHDRAGRDDRLRLDHGAVQHLRARADDAVVLDCARVDDGRRADGHVRADLGRDVLVDLGHVHHGVVLDVCVLADRDVVHVAAHRRAVPDRAALADLDVADHRRVRRHEHALLRHGRAPGIRHKARRRVQVLRVGELALELHAHAVERLAERAEALAHGLQRLLPHGLLC